MKIGLKIMMVAALSCLIIYGCGEAQGPDSDGVENTGTKLSILFAAPTEIDVKDDSGMYSDESFSVIFDSIGYTPETEAETEIYIEGYTIEYLSSDTDAVPLDTLNVPMTIWVDANGNTKYEGLLFLKAETKLDYDARGNSATQVLYTARVSFYGVNQYGYEFTHVVEASFLLTDYPG